MVNFRTNAAGKVVLYPRNGGPAIERDPVDAREILRQDDTYSLEPIGNMVIKETGDKNPVVTEQERIDEVEKMTKPELLAKAEAMGIQEVSSLDTKDKIKQAIISRIKGEANTDSN